jgi:hypothetical protein
MRKRGLLFVILATVAWLSLSSLARADQILYILVGTENPLPLYQQSQSPLAFQPIKKSLPLLGFRPVWQDVAWEDERYIALRDDQENSIWIRYEPARMMLFNTNEEGIAKELPPAKELILKMSQGLRCQQLYDFWQGLHPALPSEDGFNFRIALLIAGTCSDLADTLILAKPPEDASKLYELPVKMLTGLPQLPDIVAQRQIIQRKIALINSQLGCIKELTKRIPPENKEAQKGFSAMLMSPIAIQPAADDHRTGLDQQCQKFLDSGCAIEVFNKIHPVTVAVIQKWLRKYRRAIEAQAKQLEATGLEAGVVMFEPQLIPAGDITLACDDDNGIAMKIRLTPTPYPENAKLDQACNLANTEKFLIKNMVTDVFDRDFDLLDARIKSIQIEIHQRPDNSDRYPFVEFTYSAYLKLGNNRSMSEFWSRAVNFAKEYWKKNPCLEKKSPN